MIFNLDIAGFGVRVDVDAAFGSFRLPASYAPFRADAPDTAAGAHLLTLKVRPGVASSPELIEGMTPVATGINDLGEARLFADGDRYSVALSPMPGAGFRFMKMEPGFASAELRLHPADRFAAFTVDSMLRILFSQAVVDRGAFMLHASAVVADGRAYLFMGKSGTGKSTHARQWMKAFPGAELLNDDNPIVRLLPDGALRVYGSPWSGKTRCYRNESAPVAGFVRLRQAPLNSYRAAADIEAFVAILPGVSVITHSRPLYQRVCSTLTAAAALVPVGILDCRPDEDAARTCRAALADSCGSYASI